MGEKAKRKSSGKDASKEAKKTKTAVDTTGEELSSSAQKRQLKKERQSHRRHAETVTEAKSLWNKLRVKSNTPEDTKELMEQVMTLIRGKVNEIALQHDASRVIQAAVQFGNDEQRKELLKEICAESAAGLAELSKIQYAHFCCLKFIKYCSRDQECVKMMIKGFKGSIPKLAVHSVGSRVLESIFLNLPAKSTMTLKQELYGPHFSLFVQDIKSTPTLKSNLDSATSETQKQAAIKFVKDILSKGMTKSFFGFTYFQDLLAEFIEVADADEIRTMGSSIVDHSIHLLSTRTGTRVVAACAAYGTPKDRKRICKSLKGYTTSSLLHKDAYLALLRLVQVTDDTVSINKSVFNEILTAPKDESNENAANPLLQLALSETGSKLFLMLLVEDDEARSKYFDPYERSILEAVAMVRENGQDVPTSKKDPAARRQELVKFLEPSVEELCTSHTMELLKSLPGSRVIKEFYNRTGSKAVANAVIKACESELENGDTDIFEDPVGHRTIKNLILCDADRDTAVFSTAFFEKFSGRLTDVVKSNRGAFVVSALLKVDSLSEKVATKLKSMKKRLQELSRGKGQTAGFGALLKALSS